MSRKAQPGRGTRSAGAGNKTKKEETGYGEGGGWERRGRRARSWVSPGLLRLRLAMLVFTFSFLVSSVSLMWAGGVAAAGPLEWSAVVGFIASVILACVLRASARGAG